MFGFFETTSIKGTDNSVNVKEQVEKGATLNVIGDRNTIHIADTVKTSDLVVILQGDDMSLEIEEGVRIVGRIALKGAGATVRIGRRSTFERLNVVCIEGKTIDIGCDFVEIRTSDGHSVLSFPERRRLNVPADTRVGSHVWIGSYVTILKGVSIADDVIVGARSLVTKSITLPHCAIAGVPAKIVRRGVTWDRSLLPYESVLSQQCLIDDDT
jgi:acetyltransferase-like isoleucine patch superfamily enzyme